MRHDQTALVQYLKMKQPVLFGKLDELRTAVQRWLSYIPQTFPHYTSHTVQHSDTIILHMSKLLFQDNDPSRPSLMISAMEAYIAAASAYLHDSGMVISDEGKSKILASDEWKDWTTDGGAAVKRWADIQAFREGSSPTDKSLRDFLADVQTRFLIAEFVRRVHHLRAKDILTKNEDQLAQFAFHDPSLLRAIGDVCVAHGLQPRDLEDRDRYPDRRDIDGQEVNLQFLAILLRLGDLLDMSHDRACPLLLNASCPLPAESLAHWTQYRRITHHLTAPDRIEVTAECENQEEHRFLADWCQWLVQEVRHAQTLISRSRRHQSWQLPVVTMDDPNPTVIIRPAANANYIPSNWKFELDHDVVFKRLVEDIYESPIIFIRELIQNSLDAMRCRLYLDLKDRGEQTPDFPTQVGEEIRARYPLRLSLESREVRNELSGSVELRQAVVVEDCGMGMDKDIVKSYLLQVGRSFYTTHEFQHAFRFVPASRFGLGFLSVFGVSDRVTVDTFKPTSRSADGPIRLVLTGPRNYLLMEKGLRGTSGTRIEVLLREPLSAGRFTEAVKSWCKKVEFPVHINDSGAETLIRAEKPSDFVYELPDVTEPGARFVLRDFPLNRPGVEGELYVLAYVDEDGERWDLQSWSKYSYPRKSPQASAPPFPESIECSNGIVVQSPYRSNGGAERVDYRDGSLTPTLSRRSRRHLYALHREEADPRISSRWAELLTNHLQSERTKFRNSWNYRQSLMRFFPLKPFWRSVPNTIPFHTSRGLELSALAGAASRARFATVCTEHGQDKAALNVPISSNPDPVLIDDDLDRLSDWCRTELFRRRTVEGIQLLDVGGALLTWRAMREGEELVSSSSRPAYFAHFGLTTLVGIPIHKTLDDNFYAVLLNLDNPFVEWLLRVRKHCIAHEYSLTPESFEHIFDYLYDSVRYYVRDELTLYLRKWRELREIPPDLLPPVDQIKPEMTSLRAWRRAAKSAS
jgi:hypothetical protein